MRNTGLFFLVALLCGCSSLKPLRQDVKKDPLIKQHVVAICSLGPIPLIEEGIFLGSSHGSFMLLVDDRVLLLPKAQCALDFAPKEEEPTVLPSLQKSI